MRPHIQYLLPMLLLALAAHGEVTLRQCYDATASNFPEVKRLGLISQTRALDFEQAKKAHLPQVQAYAQATWQNHAASFPESMENLYKQMNVDMRGMPKDQYKIGVDASQNLWDGGALNAKTERFNAEEKASQAQSKLTVYQVCKQVNELYFGILLLEAGIRQNDEKMKLLESNHKLVASMVRNNVAILADAQRIEVEMESTKQQRFTLEENEKTYRRMLSLLTGLDLENETLAMPPELASSATVSATHPQLLVLDARHDALEAQRAGIKASLMPQVSAFSQAYYGRPGYDMFQTMSDNKFSFNFLVGVKAVWNIGGWYNRKVNEARILNGEQELAVEREKFLFNTGIETATKQGTINAKQREMTEDDRIVNLRQSIRHSTESKLAHGTIVTDDLIRDITAEHLARLAKDYHRIEMLKAEYDLQYITVANR